jgi:hypothetical protein
MTIPVQQLTSWSSYPSPRRSASAHAAVKAALLSSGRFANHVVELYVQGSYRNHVNTRRDSDVDIVAELTSVCEFDTNRLNPWSAAHFWRVIQRSDYGYQPFRGDVHAALTDRFPQSVIPHSKAIEVRGNGWRLKVDVLPAIRYRQVYAFDGTNVSSDDGIAFWTAEGRRIVNWPHQHFNNGVQKNEVTGGNFKPTVRMFKNARRVAAETGLMADGLAPSYFMQGLLWNVPDEIFIADRAKTYCDVVNWLVHNRYWEHQFRCQNGIEMLFGNSPEQWDLSSSFTAVDALVQLWNEWN